MTRLLLRILGGLLLLPMVFYAADWAVWRVRTARGNGTDQVEVSSMSVATLKRNREEYYFDGDLTVACSRSLLPMYSAEVRLTPCWYLRRNRTVVTRY